MAGGSSGFLRFKTLNQERGIDALIQLGVRGNLLALLGSGKLKLGIFRIVNKWIGLHYSLPLPNLSILVIHGKRPITCCSGVGFARGYVNSLVQSRRPAQCQSCSIV